MADLREDLVNQEIEIILSSFAEIPDLGILTKEAIECSTPRGKAGRLLFLPLMVCEAICGDQIRAIKVAAAMILFKAAAELYDDIEDQDVPESFAARRGMPIAINTATTMVMMAEKTMGRLHLEKGIPQHRVLKTIETVNDCYLTACTGQHLDLQLMAGKKIDEDVYLKIAAMKSGAQLGCFCKAGAMLASDDDEKINSFSRFGYNLGMIVQIANDIQGIEKGTDILRRKMTLPVIYALSAAEGDALQELTAAYLEANQTAPDVPRVTELLSSTGAMYYAAMRLESYREAADVALAATEIAEEPMQEFRKLFE